MLGVGGPVSDRELEGKPHECREEVVAGQAVVGFGGALVEAGVGDLGGEVELGEAEVARDLLAQRCVVDLQERLLDLWPLADGGQDCLAQIEAERFPGNGIRGLEDLLSSQGMRRVVEEDLHAVRRGAD